MAEPVDTWKTKIILGRYEQILKEEIRNFSIAYAELPEKFHGYLSEFPNNILAFHGTLSEEEKAALDKKECKFYETGGKVYIKSVIPFLGVNGCIAMAQEDGDYFSNKMEIVQVGEKNYVKVTVTVKAGSSEGIAMVDGDVEIAASNALRKALNNLGYGRFPLDYTHFGDNATVIKFREFLKTQK